MGIRINAAFMAGLLVCWTTSLSAAAAGDFRLADAIKKQDKAAVRELLKAHADVNAPQPDGATPLVWAAHWDDLETADLLIRAGANVNRANEYGVTALSVACVNRSAALVEALLKAGADPNIAQNNGETPLMTCARTGNGAAVKLLLDRGAKVNAQEAEQHQTALMWAVAAKNADVVRLLVDHGADVSARTQTGFTPLMFAAQQGDLESAHVLIDRGVDVNAAAPKYGNALTVASASRNEALALYLLDKGADPNVADGFGISPLHYSIARGISDITNIAPTTAFDGSYRTRPSNMRDLAKALVAHGANVNARIKKILITFGTIVGLNGTGAPSMVDATPLFLAALTADVDLMRLLLAAGADPSIKAQRGTTTLLAAAGGVFDAYRSEEEKRMALDAVTLLVDLGANIHESNAAGQAPIHAAAFTGATAMVQYLADKGADLNAVTRIGETPWSMASGISPNAMNAAFWTYHKDTVELLVRLGATPMPPDKIELLKQGELRGNGAPTRVPQTDPETDQEIDKLMRLPFVVSGVFIFSACAAVMPLFAQEDGPYLFKTHCSLCHEANGNEEARGPDREVLKQMTPEHILQVLETGIMKGQAAERSRTQRRVLAEYLSGKPFGNASPDLIPKSAFCKDAPASTNRTAGPTDWNGWGVTVTNTRFAAAPAAGLSASDVPRLKLKWAFGYPGATSGGSQPVVVGGRLYVATAEGDVFALDPKSGCIYWNFQADAGVRSAINIGNTAAGAPVAYFGDQSANVYEIDATNGKLLWKTKIDTHPRAAITGAPTLYDGRLYVPVSSREESQVTDPRYPCCQFRGSMVALNPTSGQVIWKTYTVEEEARKIGTNDIGTQLWGPSGVATWNAPTIDAKRNLLYVGTGNNYSPPATAASDAIVAFDLVSGKIQWIKQFTENDIWNLSCRSASRDPKVCPDADAPDFDFVASPILADLKDGRQVIIAANKSSVVAALDPDQKGQIIWQQRMGKGSASGGIMWGPAVDGEKVYAANNDFNRTNPQESGGVSAFDLSSGRLAWSVGPPTCENRKTCKPSHSSAVTAIPGVLFAGTMDGRLRAISSADGKVIWEYDTSKEFETVNSVKANGGSMSNAGPTVVGGMVFVNSGYSHHGGITPGNVLLAFSVD